MKNFNWNRFPQIAHAMPQAMALTAHGQRIIERAEGKRVTRLHAPEQSNVIRRGSLRAVRN